MNSHASVALQPASWVRRGAPDQLITLREFFRHPRDVGSAFPASRHLVDAVLGPTDFSAMRLVVEYGPGSGCFTRAMLDRMPQDSHLVAIDNNRRFVRHLQRSIADPRLHAVTGCALQVRTILQSLQLDSVDLVVTGIPFSTMPEPVGSAIVAASAGLLSPDGQLVAYQMRDAVEPMLHRHFDQVGRSRCWRNLPPCHIFRASLPLRG